MVAAAADKIYGQAIRTEISDEAAAEICAGETRATQCSYASAIGEYHVQIRPDQRWNRHIFLEPPSHPKILAIANNTAVNEETIRQHGLMYPTGGWVRTTLSGITMSIMIGHGVRNFLAPAIPGGSPSLTDLNALTFEHVENWEEFSSGASCAPLWRDPFDDVLAYELMFRAGIYTAQRYNASWFQDRLDPGWEVHRNVTGTPVSPVNVFVTDWRYFAGASSLEIVSIVAILFTFYGWWRLDPERSLSPLEIAKVSSGKFTDSLAPLI